jgi:hypothetical protein
VTTPGSAASTNKELEVTKHNVWTVPHGDGWANRREGASRVSQAFDTKQEAQQAGRDTARREHVEHVVQDRHGKFDERYSYGNDPFPPRG